MASDDGKDRGGLSSGARLGLVVGALAVLVAAFLIARGGGDDNGSGDSGTQATTTQSRTSTDSQTTTDDSGSKTQTQAQPPEVPVRTIRVKGGQAVGGVDTITYHDGDQVRLRVTSDADDEVHLHGYDIEKPVTPSAPAVFSFKADIEGRFDIELHSTDTQIALLQVEPKG
jgi:FtsP/CotA-like multicopper oxidase with cupredoxin domain